MWFLRGLFAKRSLAGIARPTRVRVRGTIAEGSAIESPVTGRRAAVLAWFFSRRYTQYGSSQQGAGAVDRDAHRLLHAGLLAPEWVLVEVDGQRVRAASAALEARIASSEWDGEILEELPDFARHVRVRVSDPNLRYGERWLAAGDTVILTATVSPVVEAVGTPYRESQRERPPRADFEAVGPVSLEDTIGSDLRVRRG